MVDLSVDPPLGAKIIGGCRGPVLHLVTSAASLLEGDELYVHLVIEPGSRLTVLSVAAQMAHPCLDGGSTRLHVDAQVGEGSTLTWAPEPLIICAQSTHVSTTRIELDGDAALDWTDELVLGRTGEDLGTIALVTELGIIVDGRPLLEDGMELRPSEASSWMGPAVLDDARYVGTRILRGVAPTIDTDDERRMWTELAGGGHLGRVVCQDPVTGRRQVSRPLAPVGHGRRVTE